MDDIREWISDNLRYIILVVAILLLLVIGVFGVKAIRHLGGNKNKAEKTVEKTVETEGTSEAASESATADASGSLVQNEGKVLTMMTSYYTARTNKDLETLKKLDPSIDEETEKENLDNSSVESYSNIKTYSVAGPTDGSVVVYACYDGKVEDIDTLVPSLTQYFLKTDSEGNYYIADPDATETEFIEKVKASEEVSKLLEQVKKACDDATASDPVLKEFMSKFGNTQSGSSASDDDDDDAEDAEEMDEEIMYAIDTCNVRSVPSADSMDTVIGGVTYGEEVTVTGKQGDWYIIDFNGQEAYVTAEFIVSENEFYGTTDDEDTEEEEYVDEEMDDEVDEDTEVSEEDVEI